jgi:hypothetical protein
LACLPEASSELSLKPALNPAGGPKYGKKGQRQRQKRQRGRQHYPSDFFVNHGSIPFLRTFPRFAAEPSPGPRGLEAVSWVISASVISLKINEEICSPRLGIAGSPHRQTESLPRRSSEQRAIASSHTLRRLSRTYPRRKCWPFSCGSPQARLLALGVEGPAGNPLRAPEPGGGRNLPPPPGWLCPNGGGRRLELGAEVRAQHRYGRDDYTSDERHHEPVFHGARPRLVLEKISDLFHLMSLQGFLILGFG